MSRSRKKRKIRAGVEQLEQEGDVDKKNDRKDKKDQLQIGANAEIVLLC